MPNLRSLFLLLLLGTASAALALGIRDDLRRPAEAPTSAEVDAAASGQTLEIPEMPKYDPPPIERFAAALDRPLLKVLIMFTLRVITGAAIVLRPVG